MLLSGKDSMGVIWGAMQAQELLADIAVLEVAVLKLKEKSTALRSQVVQEQTKREIAELHRERSGPILQPKGQGSPVPPPSPQQMIICADSQCNRPSHALVTPEQPEFLTATSVQDDKMFPCSPSPGHLWKVSPFGSWPLYVHAFFHIFLELFKPKFCWWVGSVQEHQSSSHHKDLCLAILETAEEDQLSLSHLQNLQHLNPLKDRQCQSAESCQQLKNLEEGKDHISPNGDNVQSLFSFHDRHSMKPSNIRHCLTPTGTATCEYRLSGVLPAVIAEGPLHCLLSRSSSQEQEKCIVPVTTSLKPLHVKDVPSQSPPSNQIELWSFSSEHDHIAGSGFGLKTFTYEEQPWSQKAESASVDEVRDCNYNKERGISGVLHFIRLKHSVDKDAVFVSKGMHKENLQGKSFWWFIDVCWSHSSNPCTTLLSWRSKRKGGGDFTKGIFTNHQHWALWDTWYVQPLPETSTGCWCLCVILLHYICQSKIVVCTITMLHFWTFYIFTEL